MPTKKSSSTEPNYWILVLANSDKANKHYNAQVVFDAQLRRKAWGLRVGSKNYKNMKKGDIVLLYIGSPYCAFAGCAVLAESPREFSKSEQQKLMDKKYRRKPVSGVKLSQIRRFNVQVPTPLLIPELTFVKNKKNWGMSFQGSSIKIDPINYQMILSVACMLNPALAKALKPKVKSSTKTTFNRDQRATQ
jgi:hypothetical protein